MKRVILYIVILAVLFWLPVQRADVGQLRPVQLISFYLENDTFVLATDTGDIGSGRTVSEAFENLKQTTPAVIYLDTAEFLLVTPDALTYLSQLDGYVKQNVKLCLQETPLNPQKAAQYLAVQKHLPKIQQYAGEKLPALRSTGERLILC